MFLKSEIERLYKLGVFTDKEYEEFMKVGFNDKGELNPCVLPKDADLKYNLKFDPRNFNVLDVLKQSVPWMGAEGDFPELFGKYGCPYYGIYDGWDWWTLKNLTEGAIVHGKKPIETATELEIWKMIALSSIYWYHCYSDWHDREQKLAHDWEMCYHKVNGDFDHFNLDKETLDKIQPPW